MLDFGLFVSFNNFKGIFVRFLQRDFLTALTVIFCPSQVIREGYSLMGMIPSEGVQKRKSQKVPKIYFHNFFDILGKQSQNYNAKSSYSQKKIHNI